MKLRGDRLEVLRVLASREHVPLYEIMKLYQANYRARISELRDMGWDIPAPKMSRNRAGNMMSVYSMPYLERRRVKEVLRGMA